MAIDSLAKRYSALIVGVPYFRLIIPDGSISKADRQTIDLCYGGIAAAAAAVTPTLTLVMSKQAFIQNRLVAVGTNKNAQRLRAVN